MRILSSKVHMDYKKIGTVAKKTFFLFSLKFRNNIRQNTLKIERKKEFKMRLLNRN